MTINNDLTATPLSILAIAYLNTTNQRAKDRLFINISEHYMPKISKLISANPKWKEDILQIYYLQILKALSKWSRNKSNFETYLYQYIIAVPRLFMDDKNMFHENINVSFMNNELMSEIFEDELNIWQRIQDTKFLHNLKDE